MKLRRLLAALTRVVTTAVLVAGPPGAGAHDDVGAIAVVTATPTRP